MPELHQVKVRLLPDGVAWDLAVRSHLGVELELDAPPDPIEIPQNALVEIESLDTLCLGKVGLCEAGRVLVILEHTVDLHKLGRIQEVWHAPQA